MTSEFDRRIAERTAIIGVVGLGYVGLPLAIAYADSGFRVVGVDISRERVQVIDRGESPILDVPSAKVAEHVRAGRLSARTSYDALSQVDAVFVCVPTPFDHSKSPDLTYIEAAARGLCEVMRKDQLFLLESTTYPGTTEEVLIPILARSGLQVGRDFYVAFSPERIDPGNRQFTIANTPKVVGGADPESTRRALMVLRQIVRGGQVHAVSSPRVAEMTKLLENTFRAVNIALVNELAMLCDRMGIDVWEVIEGARSKPYGFMAFFPGPGVGGHCIPVDPYYLSWKARQFDFSTKFIELAADTNQSMPLFTVDKLRRALSERGLLLRGSHVLVLGAAFKPDIDDARNSAAIRVIEVLAHEGAVVRYHDPHVPSVRLRSGLYGNGPPARELRSTPLTDRELAEADCVAILVGHSAVDYDRVLRRSRFVFDAVNATAQLSGGALVRL